MTFKVDVSLKILISTGWHRNSTSLDSLKFGLFEKHSKFEKNLPHGFDKSADSQVNVKTMRKIFSKFVRFSESPNFITSGI